MSLPEYCATHTFKEFLEMMNDVTDRKDQLDPIQNNCKYGYVLPDRCRYMRHLGCECGAYPPC